MTRSAQSAAMPSPFPPIEDYAFLSDCHTGALVAPDGSVDWLSVPRFDSPSVFGSLLDRGAGMFRLGPFGINVPTARAYEPGTNVLVTTWKTQTGWIEVRDALTIGPPQREDLVTPHTRPPADSDADHLLVRTVRGIEGVVEVELICDPVFDYGRTPGEWELTGDDRHSADATGAGVTVRLRTDMALGIEGDQVRARHNIGAGDRLYCALSWSDDLAAPATVEEADERIDVTTALWRSWLDRARIPDHRWRDPLQRSALTIKGLTYAPTGATVAALTTSLPETPGRRAQLGLPLQLDARFHVHVAGAALPEPGLGGRGVHPVHRRPGAERRRRDADHVRHRRAPRPDGVDARRPFGLRGRAAGPDRQRRVRPAPERRLRRRPGFDPAAHAPQRATPAPDLAGRGGASDVRRRRSGATRTRGSGRRAARRSTTFPRS